MSDPIPDLLQPVRLSTRVRRNRDDAFRIFSEQIAAWWPTDRYSFDFSRVPEIRLDPFVGGRFYEHYADGGEHTVGSVLAWEPPRRLAFTWAHDDWVAPTEVEVRFVAEDPEVTRVEVEHRNWERLGAGGARSRDQYANGWPGVLAAFTEAAGAA